MLFLIESLNKKYGKALDQDSMVDLVEIDYYPQNRIKPGKKSQ